MSLMDSLKFRYSRWRARRDASRSLPTASKLERAEIAELQHAFEALPERRRKHNCLRDVGGMIRSYHYAAFTALLESAVVRTEDRAIAAPWADAWYRWVSAAFLRAYLDTTVGAPFLPAPADLEVILGAHVLQKAFHELRGELDHCAETISIPLSSIIERAEL